MEEIKEARNNINPNKCPGPDSICDAHFPEDFNHIIINIFEVWCNRQSIGKENWCIIVPIYKNGDRNLAENYRPIALINFLVKLYESTILKKYQTSWVKILKVINLASHKRNQLNYNMKY